MITNTNDDDEMIVPNMMKYSDVWICFIKVFVSKTKVVCKAASACKCKHKVV